MLAKDYYLLALKNKAYRYRSWVISAFSILISSDFDSIKDLYPYYLIRKDNTYYFYNDKNEWEKITDKSADKPLFNNMDKLEITKDDVVNLKSSSVVTTYGNLLFNYIVLIEAFGSKIQYLNSKKECDIKYVEAIIPLLYKENPLDGEEKDPDSIYTDEYLRFTDAVFTLSAYTQVWTPAATPRSLTCHPDTAKFKAKLIEQYKDNLNDPSVIAKIDAELIKFDYENWIKGDESEGFLISKKSKNIVRKKQFLMYGAEPGLVNKVEVTPIINSLSEGLEIDKFDVYANVLRAGSYNRGAETEKGGEAVKWLLRSSSNVNIIDTDCKSTLGVYVDVNESNYINLIGFTLISTDKTTGGDESIKITADNAKSYIGKRVYRRSPMYCKLDRTDYCKVCVGDKLGLHPAGASIAISSEGSVLLSIFMSAAHSKGLSLARLNLDSFH